ncbi:hypothetical protein [Streptoalloteichus hindustanus]|uniref:Uncharacterized protein n=1 Tax=Streptoalloteichus hindustanus TaxID=2017 RepID=A0A1M5H083_STRHI|nr:hypothetical protein [Streptoalloteichus hindustanus]SHG09325.1 hypothetical protein SAMN05444320_106341 [Streptoalloteichus hindustanus]
MIQDELPESVASAVIGFITGSLLHEIDDDRREVTAPRVRHRAEVYRPR